MNELATKLTRLVNKERIKSTLFEMVKIPSPTTHARPFAEYFAGVLRGVGMTDVQLIETPNWPESPSVVGWRRGAAGGPTLHFNGHMDHIHQEHVAPYIEGDLVYGRGSADMKFGLAGMVELVRVLNDAGVQLPGNLLLSGHDMHEGPWGHSEGVRNLIERGFVGDAVIVTEGPKDAVYIGNTSNALFHIDLKWEGASIHELTIPDGTPNLLEIGGAVVVALTELKQRVIARQDPLLGHERMFLGILRSGDFYNRLPTSCHIVGTRRFPPETTRVEVEREIRAAVMAGVGDAPIEVKVDATSEGNDGFRISPDMPLVQMLRASYAEVHGRPLPLGVQLFGADNAKFLNWGKTQAVGYGNDLTKAHADLEWCDVNRVVEIVQVWLVTTLKYFKLA
jgi:acetylornithine deacetylase/succinyl-diaminopimelate desuccinylase-like protein